MMDSYLYHFRFMRLLFLLSLFLVLLTGSLSSLQPLCLEEERSALLQLKDSFIINKYASSDPSACSKLASWTPQGEHSDCCFWDGVDCNEDTGHVIGLHLSSNCLYGSINSTISLFRLLQLQWLNLAANDFNDSQISFRVGDLSRLTYLNLSYSMFSRQIPLEVSPLQVSSLDLSGNSDLYTASDLRSLVQNLTSLEELLLFHVNISSTILESLANLSSLKNLDLEYCQLHGEFPTRLFHLPSLRVLKIGGNQNLTGHLPKFHLGSPLQVLSVKQTSFFGKLPASIGNLSSLHVLKFRNCYFLGFIPSSLTNLSQLTILDLSKKILIGTIPSSLSTKLTRLDLSENILTGHIHSSFSTNLIQLKYLDLSFNKFSGMLEFDMFLGIKRLRVLILSSNNLTLLTKANLNDTLPQFEHLDLSTYCNLRKFPDFLGNQKELRWLDLRDNNLQGLAPKWFYNTSIETLWVLILSDNFLIGFEQYSVVLPWTNLQSLVVENNLLQGSFPIPQLSVKIYRVRQNLIREMSPLICNLSSLFVLDLSYNKLSGKLHPCLGNFSSFSTSTTKQQLPWHHPKHMGIREQLKDD